MKKLFLIIAIISFSETMYSQVTLDYKTSLFSDGYGWFYCSIVNKSNLTLLCYANQNQYHKSGQPIYILQGTIGAPDKNNLNLGEGDPGAGVVKYKVIYNDPTKKELTKEGAIWYKHNPNGKDQLEMEAGEGTLDILVAK